LYFGHEGNKSSVIIFRLMHGCNGMMLTFS